jgi:putative ABC transport system permease protein
MTADTARRRYRHLLRIAPSRLRDRHAAEMEQAFLLAWRQARSAGRFASLAVWARAIGDLARAALREPFGRRLRRVPSERRSWMLGTDLRYALRSFRRQRMASGLVVLMLALGIAANIVVFSLVNALLLRPFPFKHPDRLVFFNEKAPRWNLDVVGINYPDFWQWQQTQRAFEAMAIWDGRAFNLSDEQNPVRILGGQVSRDFATVLGLQPILGRMFTPDEERPNAPRVVVLSERLWRERFGADQNIVGQSLRLDGVPWTIIGVLPARAEFPGESALWVPYDGDPKQTFQAYGGSGIGRLKPGITVEQAEADLLRAHEAVWGERDKERVVSPFVRPLRDVLVEDSRSAIPPLVGSVALLLVVACANVASIMLARAIARRREIGIRLAIGAGRARLMRQLFVENLLMSVVGGVIGTIAGRAALSWLVASLDTQLPRWANFALDGRVLAFSIGLSLLATLLFGWAPALHAARGDVRSAMTDTAAGSTMSPRGRRTLTWLVGAEFTLAAVLIIGGGLLYRAFDKVRHVDPGFRPDHVLTFRLALPTPKYEKHERRLAFWDDLLTRLRAQPGVTSAGAVSCPPLDCHMGMFYRIEGAPPRKAGDPDPVTLTRMASEGYFDTLGIRLAHGRFFELADRQPKSPLVVIVNETFARTFWPNVPDPTGKRLSIAGEKEWITVVGVTRDIKHYGFERPMRPGLYFPLSWTQRLNLVVTVRTAGEPNAFVGTARRIVQQVDPEMPLFRIRTMDQAVTESLRRRALYSWMLAVFAVMALVLAVGGTYGVTSYLVSQRSREIGIRLAIGAGPRDIFGAVLRTSARAVVIGVTLGALAAIALARLLGDMLFGVSPADPLVLGIATTTLLVAALLANWLPARRAARTDPMLSLRT